MILGLSCRPHSVLIFFGGLKVAFIMIPLFLRFLSGSRVAEVATLAATVLAKGKQEVNIVYYGPTHRKEDQAIMKKF